MSDIKKEAAEIIKQENDEWDSNMDSQELDRLILNKKQKIQGCIYLILFSAIGLFIFFGNITVGGESTNAFGAIYNGFVNLFGETIWWILLAVTLGNLCAHIYYRYIKKGTVNHAFANIYNNDGPIKTFFYVLGALYTCIWTLYVSLHVNMPEMIVGENTGGSVYPPIVKGVFGVLIMGAICMPFLLNYGFMEIVGSLLEPIMRPLFKVPGKAALNAVSSFVSSSSLGVLITNRLWKNNIYTEKECVAIMTSFSAVSIGSAFIVINIAGCSELWLKIYGLSFVIVFLIEIILIRVWPISAKQEVYVDGTVQTAERKKSEAAYSIQSVIRGVNRGVKRAAISKGVLPDIFDSLKDTIIVVPQVIAMLAAIGLSGMILAEYTPVFDWLGWIFRPLLMLFHIPDAEVIASAIPVGIAEMFLPALVISGKAASISIEARAFVCLVSICQIIFFSETGTVILATKSPIKFWELCVLFVERTVLAIIFGAIAMHLFL